MVDNLQWMLSQRLKEIMKSRGMTKKEFAEELGINRTTLYLYESGKRMVPTELIYSLYEHYKIEPNEVFDVKS